VITYAVRFEVTVTVETGEHVTAYASRLDSGLRRLEDDPVVAARCLFHTRRGPHHGLARVTVSVRARDQARALTAALRVLRLAAGGDAQAWELAQAKVAVGPERGG
jgi:hypothetical protein